MNTDTWTEEEKKDVIDSCQKAYRSIVGALLAAYKNMDKDAQEVFQERYPEYFDEDGNLLWKEQKKE